MELQNTTAVSQVSTPSTQQMETAPAQTDGRAPTDAKATTTDPTPEVPLPIPASPSQTGLVSKASLSDDKAEQKSDTSGASSAQRTLKPYGIIMLPEKLETPQQVPLPDTSSE